MTNKRTAASEAEPTKVTELTGEALKAAIRSAVAKGPISYDDIPEAVYGVVTCELDEGLFMALVDAVQQLLLDHEIMHRDPDGLIVPYPVTTVTPVGPAGHMAIRKLILTGLADGPLPECELRGKIRDLGAATIREYAPEAADPSTVAFLIIAITLDQMVADGEICRTADGTVMLQSPTNPEPATGVTPFPIDVPTADPASLTVILAQDHQQVHACGDPHPANGWSVMFTLNMVTRELRAEFSDGTGPKYTDTNGLYDDGRDLWVSPGSFERTPRILAWVHGISHLDAGRVNIYLERMAPFAARLLDSVQPLTSAGAEGWDWTVEAAAAYRKCRIITSNGLAYEVGDYWDTDGLLAFEDVAAGIEPEPGSTWDLSDASAWSDRLLDEIAVQMTQSPLSPRLYNIRQWVKDTYGWDYPGTPTLRVVGARAGLRRVRAREAETVTGYPPVDAAEFYKDGLPIAVVFGSSHTDEMIAGLAGILRSAVAHSKRITLVGLEEFLTQRRAQMRAAKREELETVGRVATYHQEELKKAQARRAELIEDIIGWREPEDYTDKGVLKAAQLAEKAGMTRQGLTDLVERLEA